MITATDITAAVRAVEQEREVRTAEWEARTGRTRAFASTSTIIAAADLAARLGCSQRELRTAMAEHAGAVASAIGARRVRYERPANRITDSHPAQYVFERLLSVR